MWGTPVSYYHRIRCSKEHIQRVDMFCKNSSFWKFFILLLFAAFIETNLSMAQLLFEDVIDITNNISLDESEQFVNVRPLVSVDQEGQLIFTDFELAEVKIYNSSGELIHKYGQSGRGPGDFRRPISTIRLSTGQLATAEFNGRLSIFAPTGGEVLKVFNVPILPLTGLHQLDENRILLVGRSREGSDETLLHIFDITEGMIIKSFFKLPFALENYGGVLHSVGIIAAASVKDNKIASVFAPLNKLFIFNHLGELEKEIDIPLRHFTPIKKVNRTMSPQEAMKFLTTFSTINKIVWLKDESFLTQYSNITDIQGPDSANGFNQRYNLAQMKLDGTIIFELRNSPVLAAVDNKTTNLFFQEPNFETPSKLKKGVLPNH